MLEQILEYLKLHPVIGSIAISIILGIITSITSEFVKQQWFEDDPFFKRSKKVFRWITLFIALAYASLVLGALWGWINDWFLRVIFLMLNTVFPFIFYHAKGKNVVEAIVNKALGKIERTDL